MEKSAQESFLFISFFCLNFLPTLMQGNRKLCERHTKFILYFRNTKGHNLPILIETRNAVKRRLYVTRIRRYSA